MPQKYRSARPLAILLSATAYLPACGGTAAPAPKHTIAHAAETETAAACDPKKHDRPFVLDWDTTDQQAFEARATNDTVIVRYEGCRLEVLHGCVNPNIRGLNGAYRPVDWTTGGLEKLEVSSEEDVSTKLPLLSGLLTARVRAGEKYKMEYFAAGVRSSTRAAIFEDDLKEIPGCKGATHFVSNYVLGAFELSSTTAVVNEKALGKSSGSRNASLRRGGDLTTCSQSGSTEQHRCGGPIRLGLRTITPGKNPDPTPLAPIPAGTLAANAQVEKGMLMRAAGVRAFNVRDGKACLAAFDEGDRLDPDPNRVSTNADGVLGLRAMCEMLVGSCALGKEHYRRSAERTHSQLPPDQVDMHVTGVVANFCQGNAGITARERAVRLDLTLRKTSDKNDAAKCLTLFRELKELLPKVGPEPLHPMELSSAKHALYGVPTCLAKAGMCKDALETDLWVTEQVAKDEIVSYPSPYRDAARELERRRKAAISAFPHRFPQCKN